LAYYKYTTLVTGASSRLTIGRKRIERDRVIKNGNKRKYSKMASEKTDQLLSDVTLGKYVGKKEKELLPDTNNLSLCFCLFFIVPKFGVYPWGPGVPSGPVHPMRKSE